jgi:hypothetical protein
MKVLPVGTELTCPKCNRVMVRSIQEIRAGMLLIIEYFESVEHKPASKEGMRCPFDRTPFAINRGGVNGEVHTKDGWI